MIPAFLVAQSDKLYAGLSIFGTFLAGRWYLAEAEMPSSGFLEKYGPLGAVAICASVATAFIKMRPGTIKAQSEAEAARAKVVAEAEVARTNAHEAATAKVIQRLEEQADRREKMFERDLDLARKRTEVERSRADTSDRIAQAENQGKHDALEQLWAAVLHIYELEAILKHADIEFPDGPDIDIKRPLKATDEKKEKLLEDRASRTSGVRLDAPTVVLRSIDVTASVESVHAEPPPNPSAL